MTEDEIAKHPASYAIAFVPTGTTITDALMTAIFQEFNSTGETVTAERVKELAEQTR